MMVSVLVGQFLTFTFIFECSEILLMSSEGYSSPSKAAAGYITSLHDMTTILRIIFFTLEYIVDDFG